MLWFDNDFHLDLADKVNKAAAYYQSKYQQTPNQCFVYPSMISDVKTQAGAIMVCSNSTIHQHQFWIGIAAQDQFNVQQMDEPSG